ncbi:unnamed protein product [Rhizophagus irregularis]|nr:unnamed protein product [Rhizophagus irregularis]
MNKEFQYLQQIFQYIEDHNQGKQDLIEDLSCADCYPEDQNLGLLENPRFREFWQFVILPRYPDSVFTQNTIRVFRKLQRQRNNQKVYRLIQELVQTIRYTIIPAFDTLVETIQFYWEVTDRFNNWEAYYSDQSSDTASNTSKMSGNQKKEDKNNESSGSEQQFGGTRSTPSIQDETWKDQRNEEGEEEEAESVISHET